MNNRQINKRKAIRLSQDAYTRTIMKVLRLPQVQNQLNEAFSIFRGDGGVTNVPSTE